MLKLVRLLTVITLALSTLLVGCSSVNRPLSQTESYNWGYYGVSGARSKLVCRKTTIAIYRDLSTPPTVKAEIVPDAKCARQAKPAGLFAKPDAPTQSSAVFKPSKS